MNAKTSPPGRVTIVIEDDGMDSGCIHEILSECISHGQVLEAFETGTTITGETFTNDLMHFLLGMKPRSRC